jgi:hypothetical protein
MMNDPLSFERGAAASGLRRVLDELAALAWLAVCLCGVVAMSAMVGVGVGAMLYPLMEAAWLAF